MPIRTDRHRIRLPLAGPRGPVRRDADDHPRPDDRERRAAGDPADLGFSAAGLAWVVNAYLIAFGGLLLLAGRLGDLIGRRRSSSPGWPSSPSPRCCAGWPRSPEMLIAARFVQGVGGALSSAVILGMIVTMFPRRGEQAKAIGVFSFVGLGRRVDRAAGRRRADPGARLALDLLRQRPDRRRRVAARRAAARAGDRARLRAGADAPGAVLVTAALMLGVYTIVDAHSLALGARRGRAAGRVRRAPGDRRAAAAAARACCARATSRARTSSRC